MFQISIFVVLGFFCALSQAVCFPKLPVNQMLYLWWNVQGFYVLVGALFLNKSAGKNLNPPVGTRANCYQRHFMSCTTRCPCIFFGNFMAKQALDTSSKKRKLFESMGDIASLFCYTVMLV